MLYFLATAAASGSSLKFGSSNPIEKVLTGSLVCKVMDATTELESIPPLKNAPSGTSEISRNRTDSSKSSRKRSHASASVNPGAASSTGTGSCQYRPCSILPSA